MPPWRSAPVSLNFDISDLVATRMDDDDVFDEFHSLLIELAHAGVVRGVRVDHVDGLADPGDYLARLRSRLPDDAWIVVEKILSRDEDLPDWPVAGTTGYEFIDHCDGLFVDGAAAERLRGPLPAFDELAREGKREVLERLFVAEVSAVAEAEGVSGEQIVERIADLDVYRTYERGSERFQQLSGPATAKGVEDTALYRYVSFISRNEVGCDPGAPAVAADDFHAFNRRRLERWPSTMNASSTHDTKRSEDIRARLHVLSEVRDEYVEHVERWMGSNATHTVEEGPDQADELYLYQTLIGTWPVDRPPDDRYVDRIAEHMRKAMREAKRNTDWRDPNEAYERATDTFVRTILAHERFRADVARFATRIARHGCVNSLAQVVLKTMSPGVPDFYQGAERCLLTLVDPDNRGPVDFDAAAETLDDVMSSDPTDLMRHWPDGRIKTYVTWRCLQARAEHNLTGYTPIEATGPHADNVVAFARGNVVAVVPRLSATISSWDGTALPVQPGRWTNLLTEQRIEALDLDALLSALPVALLVRD
jgi:(1->4)-alpha-D-glucan 1-alpha-D-glucosylmutase